MLINIKNNNSSCGSAAILNPALMMKLIGSTRKEDITASLSLSSILGFNKLKNSRNIMNIAASEKCTKINVSNVKEKIRMKASLFKL